MDTAGWLWYLLFGVFFLCSLCSSVFETALSLVGKSGGRALAEEHKKKDLGTVCRKYDRVLRALYVGNQIARFACVTVAVCVAVFPFAGKENAFLPLLGSIVSALAVSGILLFFFAWLIPAALVAKNAEKTLLACVSWLRVWAILSFPFAWIDRRLSALVLRTPVGEEPSVTEEDISDLIETAEEEGEIDEAQGELLQSALDFSDTRVGKIMTPRTAMLAVDIDDPAEEIRAALLDSSYSRLPVYEGDTDHIIGVISVKHYLKKTAEDPAVDFRSLLMEPCFVHKNMKLPAALSEMRKRHIHLMVVLDEYGGTMGIVTMEDILEEIVGEIWDESDEVLSLFTKVSEEKYLIDGSADLDEMFAFIEYTPEVLESECNTVGGWVSEMLESVPAVGNHFLFEGLEFRVEEVRENSATQISVWMPKQETEEMV